MNRIYLLLVLLLLSISAARSDWKYLGLPYTYGFIKAVNISGDRWFAGTSMTGLYYSIDSGKVWTKITEGIDAGCIWTSASIDNWVYIGSLGGGVSCSSDNGKSWFRANLGVDESLVSILAVSGNKVAAGYDMSGGVSLSIDSGRTWSFIGPNDLIVRGIAFIDDLLIASTDESGIYIYKNSEWIEANNGLDNLNLASVSVIDGVVWAGIDRGINGKLYKSTDTCKSWTLVKDQLYGSVHTMYKAGGKLFADARSLYVSHDNGVTWNDITGPSFPVTQSFYANEDIILAGTEEGVYMENVSHVASSSVSEGNGKYEIVKSCNYLPGHINVEFDCAYADDIQIRLYDFLGNSIPIENDVWKNEKRTNITINTGSFSRGVYFLEVRKKEKTEAIKIFID